MPSARSTLRSATIKHSLFQAAAQPDSALDDAIVLANAIAVSDYAWLFVPTQSGVQCVAQSQPPVHAPAAVACALKALGCDGPAMMNRQALFPSDGTSTVNIGGLSLVDGSGHPFAVLCVASKGLQRLTARQIRALRLLGRQIPSELLPGRNPAEHSLNSRSAPNGRQAEDIGPRLPQKPDASANAAADSRDQAAFLNLLLQCVGEGIFGLDTNGRCTFVNRGGAEMLGYSVDELLGQDVHSLIHHTRMDGSPHPVSECPISRAYRSGRGCRSTHDVFWRKDGSSFPVEYSSFPILDGQTIKGAVVSIADISERRRADEELRESELRFRELVENMNEVFWISTADFKQMVYVSPAYEAIWGRSCASLHASPSSWANAIHDEDREAVLAAAGAQAASGLDVEYRIVRPDGSIRWIHDRSTPIRNEDGVVYRIAGIAEDITDRRAAEEQAKRQVERISAQRAIDVAITENMDLRLTLGLLLDQVTCLLGVDAAHVMLLNKHSLQLEHFLARGFRFKNIASSQLLIGTGIAGRAALDRETIRVGVIRSEFSACQRADLIEAEQFVSYMAVPLMAKGQVYGVLEVFHRDRLDSTPEWCEFLDALCAQAAIAIENARMCDEMQRSNMELTLAYDETIEGWAKALDLRDHETEGHTRRVTDLAIRVARAMGVGEKDIVNIRRGAILHDIGKLGVPDSILLKPGKLDPDEWEIMKLHTIYAEDWLSPIVFLRAALDIPVYHHERWDGSGYPRGLRGESIPLAARIFAVVDVWDALISERPYKSAWSPTKALAHMRVQAGVHFDPIAVAALELVLKEAHVEDGSAGP